MTGTITKLRKEGKLSDAYQLALQWLNQEPENIWAKRAMAWVLYDYCKNNTQPQLRNGFIKCIYQIVLLQLPFTDELFYNRFGIIVRCVVRKCVNDSHETQPFLDQLISLLQQLPIPPHSSFHTDLMQTFLKVKNSWPKFIEFCEWWDFTNLTEEDFIAKELGDGHKDLPLAEKALMAYSKAIYIKQDHARIKRWIPQLEQYCLKHPKYTYLPYYLAKLYISEQQQEKVFETIKPFVQRKQNEFWVWELLGDASDGELQFQYYCRAMLCKTKEEMLLQMRTKMGYLLYDRGELSRAKLEFEKIQQLRFVKHWQSDRKIEEMLKTELSSIVAATENSSYYKANCRQIEPKVLGNNSAKKSLKSKRFKGTIKITEKGFGFIDNAIFVAPNLAKAFKDGDTVEGYAIEALDKKKNIPGWRAEKIKLANAH